ncbi:MAG: histidine kinase dimerization/phospho-acceptor domain-containing protein [Thermoanaerobaculum sp.]
MGVSPRRWLVLLLLTTGVLAVTMVVVAALAAHSLQERADALREGALLRMAHELEAELRELVPQEAHATLEGFCAKRQRELLGAELVGPGGAVARCGILSGNGIFEMRLLLGPNWRGLVGFPGRGRGGPMFLVRLAPAPGLGSAGYLPSLVMGGAVVGAASLLLLVFVASRGLMQREQLAQAQAEQERLAAVALAGAGLAHRIRNPLAAIKGTAQLLAQSLPEKEKERLDRMLKASERIEHLVNRLLKFSRPAEPFKERVMLADVIKHVMARVPGPVLLKAENLVVWADREHVEDMVEELLANARAFDPFGELEVSAARSGRTAVITVADRGPGPGVDPERAFDPYVTSRPEGTGLGLAIVQALARANGGKARLYPRPGGGTVAEIQLQIAES